MQDFKQGFLWEGSDGVDHVAREVLQHGVANRGSHIYTGVVMMVYTRKRAPPSKEEWK